MKRVYNELIKSHLGKDDLMLFVSGPRQVGKTTSTKQAALEISDRVAYLNFDVDEHRAIILEGQSRVAQFARLEELQEKKPILLFDEIHKYVHWKNFIKGFFDTYHHKVRVIVTGSARLDIHKKGGDSLMGRYFPYRMHPLSVRECMDSALPKTDIRDPVFVEAQIMDRLMEFGGFPMPYLKQERAFSLRWQRLRQQQLFREDIRDTSSVLDLQNLEMLAKVLMLQAGCLITYSGLANKVKVSVDTISRWIGILESFYFCFRIRPWSRNITRSLIKEPKVFLWDWSLVKDPGMKAENFIASHLLKAVHFWNDSGMGEYELYYLRDVDKKEVDFLVTKNDEPWFLVEVKLTSQSGIGKNLHYFFQEAKAKHAFQVAFNLPYVQKNCFDSCEPIIVPAATFLSQLV